MAFWVEFADRDAGCMVLPEGKAYNALKNREGNLDPGLVRAWIFARAQAVTNHVPTEMYSLPYTASPVLNAVDDPAEAEWRLCYDPKNCKGRSSCPKSRACSE